MRRFAYMAWETCLLFKIHAEESFLQSLTHTTGNDERCAYLSFQMHGRAQAVMKQGKGRVFHVVILTFLRLTLLVDLSRSLVFHLFHVRSKTHHRLILHLQANSSLSYVSVLFHQTRTSMHSVKFSSALAMKT